MTNVPLLRLNRSQIMGAADETATDERGETTDTVEKIKYLGGTKIFSYAGESTLGKAVYEEVRRRLRGNKRAPFEDYLEIAEAVFGFYRKKKKSFDLGKCRNSREREAVEHIYSGSIEPAGRVGFQLELILAGFDSDSSDSGEFRIFYISGSEGRKPTPDERMGCIGYSAMKAGGIIKGYLEQFRGDIQPQIGARILLDAVDQARKIDTGGEGKSLGSTQLIVVDSYGRYTQLSREKTSLLTRTIRRNRKGLIKDDDMERVFHEIVANNKTPREFWDSLPPKQREEIGFSLMTDMTL